MGVGNVFQRVTDGGTPRKHYECRVCGANLEKGTTACPDCGGDVAVFELA